MPVVSKQHSSHELLIWITGYSHIVLVLPSPNSTSTFTNVILLFVILYFMFMVWCLLHNISATILCWTCLFIIIIKTNNLFTKKFIWWKKVIKLKLFIFTIHTQAQIWLAWTCNLHGTIQSHSDVDMLWLWENWNRERWGSLTLRKMLISTDGFLWRHERMQLKLRIYRMSTPGLKGEWNNNLTRWRSKVVMRRNEKIEIERELEKWLTYLKKNAGISINGLNW